jgi:hypothetical protein
MMITLPTITHMQPRRKRLRRRWPVLPRLLCDVIAALLLAAMFVVFAILTFGFCP